jgi:hypothetical protein
MGTALSCQSIFPVSVGKQKDACPPYRLPDWLMKITIINPPHTAIGSRIPDVHLPPLGLLSVGGPLIDAGFDVELLDAEFGPLPLT